MWTIPFKIILQIWSLTVLCQTHLKKRNQKRNPGLKTGKIGFILIWRSHAIYSSLFCSTDCSDQGQFTIKLTLLLAFSTVFTCDFIFYYEVNNQDSSLPHQWMHQTMFSSIGRRYRKFHYVILHILWHNMQKFLSKILIYTIDSIVLAQVISILTLRDNEREIQAYLDSSF